MGSSIQVGHEERAEVGAEGRGNGGNQQTKCPEGEAHYRLENTVLINTNQSELTYPAIASIITLCLAEEESRVRVYGGQCLCECHPACAGSKVIVDLRLRFSLNCSRNEMKRLVKTSKSEMFHHRAPPQPDYSMRVIRQQLLCATLCAESDTPTDTCCFLYVGD